MFDLLKIVFIVIHTVINLIGMAANGLVVYLCLFQTPPIMKTYSVLILTSGIANFIACLSAFLVQQRIIPAGISLLLVPSGPCKILGGQFCGILHAVTLHCYSYALCMLLVCFGYRYLVLRDVLISRLQLFFTLMLFYLFPLSQLVLLILAYDDPLLLSQIIYSHFPNYDLDLACISGGVTVLEWKMFYVITSLCLSVFPIYIIICYCRRGIIQKLETRWNEMTEKTRKIHMTLLHALTFQAMLPAIFTVAVAVFALGALNIYNHPLLEYSTFAIVSLIPASAPLGTLYFIRPYNEWIQERLPGQRRKITSSACPSVPSIVAVERK